MARVIQSETYSPTFGAANQSETYSPTFGAVSQSEAYSPTFGADNLKETEWEAVSDCSTTCTEHDAVQTLVIFDWDDTLFPTSWLKKKDKLSTLDFFSEKEALLLRALEKVAESTLRTALLFGKVTIVTNGEQGWVEMSCSQAMPSLWESLLKTGEVEIVSARSTYEERAGYDPEAWKRLAFAKELRKIRDGSIPSEQQLNVISLGDSLAEQRAVVSLTKSFPNLYGKSLKFVEKPNIQELIEQHKFVHACFVEVAEHNGDLDAEIGAAGDDREAVQIE